MTLSPCLTHPEEHTWERHPKHVCNYFNALQRVVTTGRNTCLKHYMYELREFRFKHILLFATSHGKHVVSQEGKVIMRTCSPLPGYCDCSCLITVFIIINVVARWTTELFVFIEQLHVRGSGRDARSASKGGHRCDPQLQASWHPSHRHHRW